ncbi:hypothetical protein D3C87_1634100 [compost metagenome]
MPDDIGFHLGIVNRGRLEGDGTGKNTAINLGQRDIHRQITRHQPLRRGLPLRPRRSRKDHLQHRRTGRFQHRRLTVGTGRRDRKASGVHHHVGCGLGKNRLQRADGNGILEA